MSRRADAPSDVPPDRPHVFSKKDLVDVESITEDDIRLVLDTAESMREINQRAIKKVPTLRGKLVANLFFESSTRTRFSFEVAERRLSADSIAFSAAGSSVSKGETLLDTAKNLMAMAPDAIVIRHSRSGAPHLLARELPCAVVNAGDGIHEHPTQALLDALTIRRAKGRLAGLKIALCGDIAHSRVARSNVGLLSKMGAAVTLCGPRTLLPAEIERTGAIVVTRIEEALDGADVVMMLRVQRERGGGLGFPSDREYYDVFGLTPERRKLAKKDAIVMHPGPMNRGVEIDSAVADGPDSVILDQVENGVAVRMAVLYLLIGASGDDE
ncbi:MAG TPA: aspartate carbamoyltransferase catalytic subunit [Thermoanaerobaculia bacterium]|nr:aspartate carbamoyltransferase catalytic subunit [Thermoanaerobaculia bacterium]HQR68158.1 aspartate carbamoyltransferase catalytic subunit [Thermoanaerobaculia bacterium]